MVLPRDTATGGDVPKQRRRRRLQYTASKHFRLQRSAAAVEDPDSSDSDESTRTSMEPDSSPSPSSDERLLMRSWLEDQVDKGQVEGLQWLGPNILRIPWKHASRRGWSLSDDACLFKRWAMHSGKYIEEDKNSAKRWKANFRCALNSLPDVVERKDMTQKKGKDAFKIYEFKAAKRRRSFSNKHKKCMQRRKRDCCNTKQEKVEPDDDITPASSSEEETIPYKAPSRTVLPPPCAKPLPHHHQSIASMTVTSDISHLENIKTIWEEPSDVMDMGKDHSYAKNGYQLIPGSRGNLPVIVENIATRQPYFSKTEDVVMELSQLSTMPRYTDTDSVEADHLSDDSITKMISQWQDEDESTLGSSSSSMNSCSVPEAVDISLADLESLSMDQQTFGTLLKISMNQVNSTPTPINSMYTGDVYNNTDLFVENGW